MKNILLYVYSLFVLLLIIVIVISSCGNLFVDDLSINDIYGEYVFRDTLEGVRYNLSKEGEFFKMIEHNPSTIEIVKKGTYTFTNNTLSSQEELLNGRVSFQYDNENILYNLDNNLVMLRICKCEL